MFASLPRAVYVGVASSVAFILAIVLWYILAQSPLDVAKRRWDSHSISSYHIRVGVSAGVSVSSSDVTVRHGSIESATCSDAWASTCRMSDHNTYTVSQLFKIVAHLQERPEVQIQVTYDPTYGFPRLITYNNQNIADEEMTFQVDRFEVLDE